MNECLPKLINAKFQTHKQELHLFKDATHELQQAFIQGRRTVQTKISGVLNRSCTADSNYEHSMKDILLSYRDDFP